MKIISTHTQVVVSTRLTEKEALTLRAISNLESRNEYELVKTKEGFTFLETSNSIKMCRCEATIEALLQKVSLYRDITVYLP